MFCRGNIGFIVYLTRFQFASPDDTTYILWAFYARDFL